MPTIGRNEGIRVLEDFVTPAIPHADASAAKNGKVVDTANNNHSTTGSVVSKNGEQPLKNAKSSVAE